MPFISTIDNNTYRILFISMLVYSFFMGGVAYLACTDTVRDLKLIGVGLFSVLWGYFVTWVLVGDSVWWSKPIGVWFKQ